MKIKFLFFFAVILFNLQAYAAWEKLPQGYGLMEDEFDNYWDQSRITGNGNYFYVPLMTNSKIRGTSQVDLTMFNCLDGTETLIRKADYSKPWLKGEKISESNQPFHFNTMALHEYLWVHLCKKNLKATWNKSQGRSSQYDLQEQKRALDRFNRMIDMDDLRNEITRDLRR